MADQYNFHLPITTEATLKLFLQKAWGISVPDVQVCPHHSTPWRAFCDAYFARHQVTVWLASRGFGGKSFLLALLAQTEAVTLGAGVSLLGGSGAQSRRILEHTTNLWSYKNAPKQLLLTDPTKAEIKLTNDAHIEALMASQTSVRGPHPQRLRLDEVDEMSIDILEAAQGQPISKPNIPTNTVMSSTKQYADGTMAEMLKRATQKGWSVHEWCYKETMQPHGWLSQVDVLNKRNEVTEAMWKVEYDNQEPSPESRAINADAVKKMFDKSLGEYDGDAHEYIEIEAPVPEGTYSTGADWARKQDWTIIITIRDDVYPAKVVAFERTGRLEWPVMVEKYNKRLMRYGGNGTHDGTGIGDVVGDYISVRAFGFIMTGKKRADLLSNYIAAIERGDIVAPYIKWMQSEHMYASVEDIYGGSDGAHLPDTISAGALAWRTCMKGIDNETMNRMEQNLIDPSNIPADLLAAAEMSGISIQELIKTLVESKEVR